MYYRILKYLKIIDIEFRLIGENGKANWLSHSARPINNNNKINGFQSNIKNITKNKMAEEKLQKSEEKFNLIFKNNLTINAIIKLKDLTFIDINDKFIFDTGYTKQECIGKSLLNFKLFKFPGDLNNFLIELDKNKKALNHEYCFQIKSGELRYGLLSAVLIEINYETCIIANILDMTEYKKLENQIIVSAIQAEETERSRIASDLHDGLGPLLSSCKLLLYTLEEEVPMIKLNPICKKIYNTLDLSISSLKEISYNISPNILRDYGLIHAIRSYIDNLNNLKNLKIIFNSNVVNRFNNKFESNVFHIVKELINNTLKYADANIIVLILKIQKAKLSINYLEDGKGFDYEKIIATTHGAGLKNIQMRVKSLNGEVKIETKPNQGFSSIIEIEIKET